MTKGTREKSTGIVPNDATLRTMSEYGKFHFKYLGFNFKHIRSGDILTKGEFWNKHQSVAEKMLRYPTRKDADPIPPPGFTLIEYPH